MAEEKKNGKVAEQRPPSEYIVLEMIEGPDGHDAWNQIAEAFQARTGDEAKKMAASQLNLQNGMSVTLVAIPAKSWRPTTARVEVPEPKLVLS